MSVLTFPSVLTVSETTVAVIVDAFGRQVNTCQSGNSVVTFDARKSQLPHINPGIPENCACLKSIKRYLSPLL
ncbi:hypothetical protein [Klebsiella pneumoniae]|nr:hypothetical protein [Klebsiella pneumoniae]